jgi:MFS family permease
VANAFDTFLGRDARILGDGNFRILLLANITQALGSALVSPLLTSLTGPYGVSAAEIGLVMSVFTAPAILVIPLLGVLIDRYGRKPILVPALLLFGLSGTALAFTTDFTVVLALRALQGLGFAGILPVVITSIGDLYEGGEEATGQGLRFAVSGLSQAIFPVLAGGLVVLAWQYPFLLYSVAIPIALLVYIRFDDPHTPGDAKTDADGESEGADERTNGATNEEQPAEGTIRELVALASRTHVLAILLARGLPVIAWLGFFTYNSVLVVRVLEGTPQQAGVLVAAGSVAYAGAASQAGRLTTVLGGRTRPLYVANLALAVGVGLLAVALSYPIAGLGVVLAGIGFGITMSLYRSLVTGFASGPLRGKIVSLAEAGGRITATLTPIALGAVIASAAPLVGFGGAVRLAFLLIGAVGGLGGVLCVGVASRAAGSTL